MPDFPHARLLTRLSYAAMISLSMGINLLPVFLTSLGALYGTDGHSLSNEQLGRFGACIFGGLVLGILVTGPLADRWGAKLFALLGNAVIALSLVALAYAPSYEVLCVCFVSLGFGSGVLDMVLSPVVSALNPEHRASAMNWLHSFYCVGAAVTILIGAISENTGFGWRGACLVLATLPLVLIFWFGVLAFPPMTQEGGTRQPTRTLLRERWFNLALLALFLGGATELGMAQWLPAYAETHLGYSKTVSSTALLLFSVAMAVGRMIIGAAGRKWSSFTIMSAACASSAVLFVLGCFLPLPLPALISCIVVGFTGSCLWPTMLAVSADRYPNGGATMFGALAAFGNAGGIFMPWLVGVVADHSDLRWGIVTGAIAPLSMLLVLRALRRGAPATSVSPVVAAPPAL